MGPGCAGPAELYGAYISDNAFLSGIYTTIQLSSKLNSAAVHAGGSAYDSGSLRLKLALWRDRMLDVLYILIGAAFLGACVLYVDACDNL